MEFVSRDRPVHRHVCLSKVRAAQKQALLQQVSLVLLLGLMTSDSCHIAPVCYIMPGMTSFERMQTRQAAAQR